EESLAQAEEILTRLEQIQKKEAVKGGKTPKAQNNKAQEDKAKEKKTDSKQK
ncbi:MAG: hypothetical protein HY349_03955, partial [Nitrospirae bacterium]|nr:hypothetical protein [Nitrospirota bacterium]